MDGILFLLNSSLWLILLFFHPVPVLLHLPGLMADLVEEIRNHGCRRLQNLPYLHGLQPGKACYNMNVCLCVINQTNRKW